jgi:hypothetical protein
MGRVRTGAAIALPTTTRCVSAAPLACADVPTDHAAGVAGPRSKETIVAEIPIQEKRGSKLPLIIGVLALLALLAWWMMRDRGDDTVRSDTAVTQTMPADTLGGTGTAPVPDTGAAAPGTTTGTATGTSTRP